jgi:hypothetical protein
LRLLARVELLEKELTANSGTQFQRTYENSKFAQLLTAHWWRRELKDQAQVVAVSPGFVPDTGLAQTAMKRMNFNFAESVMKDAKSIPEGDFLLHQARFSCSNLTLSYRRTIDPGSIHKARSPGGSEAHFLDKLGRVVVNGNPRKFVGYSASKQVVAFFGADRTGGGCGVGLLVSRSRQIKHECFGNPDPSQVQF